VILCETKGIPRPYCNQPLTIVAQRTGHHILDAMRLRRAPDHNIEPSTRLRRKKVRAEGGQVRAGHDAARGGVRLVLATAGLGGTWGAEKERAVEVEDE
jgi:hypothetical protein